MTSDTSLTGKKALVTGASSGIGRAITLALAGQGVSLALLARRKERLEAVAEEAHQAGGEAMVCQVDLTQTEDVTNTIAKVANQLGGLDILVNAAGVALQANLTDGAPEDWRTMLDVNVFALALVSRECLPHFPESGGHVVNISSMSGHRVPGKGGFYAATKFAVRAMTEGLRQELRSAGNFTRVSSISPGFVDTELLDTYFRNSENDQPNYDRIGYPILQPTEIADLVLHQLSMPPTAEVTDILIRPTAQAT